MSLDSGQPIAVAIGHQTIQTSTLATAISLGGSLGVELIVIHVIDVSDYPIDPDSIDFEAEAALSITEVRDQISAQLSDYQHGWRWEVPRGSVAHQIVDSATRYQCQLIVVGGGYGRHGNKAVDKFHSNTARHVISHSSIPIVVVPSKRR